MSAEETEVFDECEFPDFTPFVARVCTYKRDLSDTNKNALMSTGMESLRGSVYTKGLIERLFDFERDITLVESEIFDRPDRMEVVFKYIDLTFQLLPTPSDEAYTKHAKYLHTLLQYSNKKIKPQYESQQED